MKISAATFSGSRNGSERSRKPSTMLKTAVFTPIPSASVSTTAIAKPGLSPAAEKQTSNPAWHLPTFERVFDYLEFLSTRNSASSEPPTRAERNAVERRQVARISRGNSRFQVMRTTATFSSLHRSLLTSISQASTTN